MLSSAYFPKKIDLYVLSESTLSIENKATSNTIILQPHQTIELSIQSEHSVKGIIEYAFIDKQNDTIANIQKIPISIESKFHKK